MSHDLAHCLREGTQQSHTAAENTAFMKCFLKGIVEREPLRKLFANLYFVYSALESELSQHQHHPAIAPIYFPLLNRAANLEQDLAFYYGEDWRNQITPLPAGETYVQRIHDVAHRNPILLIAHAYTRYMGDLSGGQALKNIVRSALKLTDEQGTAMYEFAELPTPDRKRAFKDCYRNALNAIELTDAEVQQIVDEANYAFELNRDVVHELESDVIEAIGAHVFELLTRQSIRGATEHPHTTSSEPALEYSI